MFRNVFLSIIFILPFGVISYKLFKYYFRNREIISKVTSDDQLRKWKVALSIIGAIICVALAFLWLAMVWVPDDQLPLIVKLLFYILLLPFILALVISLAFINALGSAVEAGGGSTRTILKNIAGAIKDESSETSEKVKLQENESDKTELLKTDAFELKDDVKMKETIQRMRLAAGILLGLVMLSLLAFWRPRLMSSFLPWAYYTFGPLLLLTIIAFFILWKKERKLKRVTTNSDTPSRLKTKREKYLLFGLLVAIGLFMVYQIWNSDYGYVYRQYFFHSKSELLLDFNRLEPVNMSDAKKTFNLHWLCQKEQTQFGNSYCGDYLFKWNSIPAMNVVFWYKDDILTYAKIDVPRWRHDELIQYIHGTFGPPHFYSARANLRNILAGTSAILKGSRGNTIIKEVNDLGIWQMDTGAMLVVNLKKELNPFLWSTVFWTSPGLASEMMSIQEHPSDRP